MIFLAALQFLTVLPVRRNFTAAQIGHSTSFFPLVGSLIGAILAGLFYVLNLILPSNLVNIMLVTFLAISTGMMHLDGLADTCDGMAGLRTPQERLHIMKDSRIGVFGAAGVVLFLVTEYLALNNIPREWMVYSLILAPTLSRWAMVLSIFVYPYARTSGLGTAYKDSVGWLQLTVSTVFALLLAVGLFRLAGLIIMAALTPIVFLQGWYFKSKLYGLTGDTYGAINEITTVAVFVIIIVLTYNRWIIS